MHSPITIIQNWFKVALQYKVLEWWKHLHNRWLILIKKSHIIKYNELENLKILRCCFISEQSSSVKKCKHWMKIKIATLYILYDMYKKKFFIKSINKINKNIGSKKWTSHLIINTIQIWISSKLEEIWAHSVALRGTWDYNFEKTAENNIQNLRKTMWFLSTLNG